MKENSQTTFRGHHDTTSTSKSFDWVGVSTSQQNFDSMISAKTDGGNQRKIMSNGMSGARNENKEIRHYAVSNPSRGCSDIYARPAELLKKSPIPPTPPLRNPGRILAGKERSPDNTSSQTDSCDTNSTGYSITSVA